MEYAFAVKWVDLFASLCFILFGAWGMHLKMKERFQEEKMEGKWFEYQSLEDAALDLVSFPGFDRDRYAFCSEGVEGFSQEELLEMIEDNGDFILPVNSNSVVVKWNSELGAKG